MKHTSPPTCTSKTPDAHPSANTPTDQSKDTYRPNTLTSPKERCTASSASTLGAVSTVNVDRTGGDLFGSPVPDRIAFFNQATRGRDQTSSGGGGGKIGASGRFKSGTNGSVSSGVSQSTFLEGEGGGKGEGRQIDEKSPLGFSYDDLFVKDSYDSFMSCSSEASLTPVSSLKIRSYPCILNSTIPSVILSLPSYYPSYYSFPHTIPHTIPRLSLTLSLILSLLLSLLVSLSLYYKHYTTLYHTIPHYITLYTLYTLYYTILHI